MKTILIYGVVIILGSLFLKWLDKIRDDNNFPPV